MIILHCRNVNDAYREGLNLLEQQGTINSSRAGEVRVMDCPVTTVYERPWERVLFNPIRDANPFFHLFEAIWMLSGSNDATFLDRFVGDFSARFAEEGGVQHGAYGHRWRRHFDMEGGGAPGLPDQLNTVVELLRNNHNDRRVVIQMWDPVADLGVDKKDVPCNLTLTPRIVEGKLDITVFCRSNDAIWGAYGANAVHFSVLQEYLAARIGVGIGRYYQISNNYHAYTNVMMLGRDHTPTLYEVQGPSASERMFASPEHIDDDIEHFMEWAQEEECWAKPQEYPFNPWFQHTAEPLFITNHFWKAGHKHDAFTMIDNAEYMSHDWQQAAREWMERRSPEKSTGQEKD